MTVSRLLYPVHTLQRQQLLPAGTVVSEEALLELITTSKGTLKKPFPLLKHKEVKDDLFPFMNSGPYQVIFAEQKRTAAVVNLMEKVSLPPPILESLDYFKQHDFYTYRHILMVFALTGLLAQDLLTHHHDMMQEIMAGPTHDFGKISIPLQVLKKTDPLTRTERAILQHHAVAGFVLLSYYLQDSQGVAARVARDHHERKDGSGYPLGRHLTDRLVEIVAVSDIYDALISPRPYRPTSYDNRTALEEITDLARQGKLSWDVVQALVACNRQSKPHYHECTVSTEKRGNPPADNRYGMTAPEDACSEDIVGRWQGPSKKSKN
jgi:HD-GYP domain-containing protein (c-di-GMP phosphodiesterase class II)